MTRIDQQVSTPGRGSRGLQGAAVMFASLSVIALLLPGPAAAISGGLCSPTPRDDCAVATASRLKLTGPVGDPHSTANWKWKGSIPSGAAFGVPNSDTDYIICTYDGDTLVSEGYVPATTSAWEPLKTGWRYFDKEQSSDGIKSMHLTATPKGLGKLQWKGSGMSLQVPGLPLSGAALTLQLVNLMTDPGTGDPVSNCWGATYPVAGQRVPDVNKLTGKCDSKKHLCTL